MKDRRTKQTMVVLIVVAVYVVLIWGIIQIEAHSPDNYSNKAIAYKNHE